MATTPVPVSAEKTVTTAGTAVPLVASKTLVASYSLRAKAANTGQIYIGNSSVDDTINDGFDSGEGESWAAHGKWHFVDLAGIYIDSDEDGEGVELRYTPHSPNA
mgnify:FL=1